MTNSDSSHSEPSASLNESALGGRCGRLAEVLLIVMVFFTLAGDPAPHVNEPHYLSRLKHYWNPDWCAGDLFLDSPEAHLVFAWAFGWVTSFMSLAATAWTGRLVVWTLLAWAWQRLSWRLVPVPLASVLSAALWITLTRLGNFAGEWVVSGVEAKCFAYVFVLLGLRELVDRRWNRLWLWLGAASAFHAVVGGWSVVICAGVWLTDGRRRAPLRAMLPGLVVGGLLALAGVIPALRLMANQPPDVAEAGRIYVFERLPHHLAILALPQDEAVERFVQHGLLLLAFLVVGHCVRSVAKSERDPVPLDSGGLALIGRFAWGAVLLAAVGLAIELALWNDPLAAARLLRYYWFRMTDIAVPLAVALDAVSLLAVGTSRRRAWAVWGLVAALVLTGWHVSSTVRHRFDNPVPPADRTRRDFAAWEDVCQWIAKNTRPDALFLTPRRAVSFKWRTGRPEVVTYKDIPQDARSMVEWHRRLHNIHYADGSTEPIASLSDLGTDRIEALAREYDFDYVLTDRSRPLNLPIVYPNSAYSNAEYVVYAVRNENAPDRKPEPGQ
jgi:hypothetical protein